MRCVRVCLFCDGLSTFITLHCGRLQVPLQSEGLTVPRSMRVLPVDMIKAVDAAARSTPATHAPSAATSDVNLAELVYCIDGTVFRPAQPEALNCPAQALTCRAISSSEVRFAFTSCYVLLPGVALFLIAVVRYFSHRRSAASA